MPRSNPSSPPHSPRDIYQTITAKIIAAIEAEPGPPVMPWHRGGLSPLIPVNAATGNEYRGVNILSLWVAALERGYRSATFATYKQWASLGAQVRKGESASPIVFYREFERVRDAGPAEDESESETVRMARGYFVFAAEQVDNFDSAAHLPADPIERIGAADAYAVATNARVVIGGSLAATSPPPTPSTCPTKHASSAAKAARGRKPFIRRCITSWRIMPPSGLCRLCAKSSARGALIADR